MPPVLVHLGTHKTGTTSIQRAGHETAARLLEHGVLYPSAARGFEGETQFGHHQLPWSIRGTWRRDIDPDAPWQALDAELARIDPARVWLSSEDIGALGEDELPRFFERLTAITGPEVRALAYLRHPFRLIQSAYKQRLRMGTTTERFPAFVAARLARVEYGALVDRWARVFGAEALTVRVFESAADAPGGLVGDVLHTVLGDRATVEAVLGGRTGAPPVTNASVDDETVQAIRQVNRLAEAAERLGLASGRARQLRVGLRKAVQRAHDGPLRPLIRLAGPLATAAEMDEVRALLCTLDYAPLADWLTAEDLARLRT